MGGRNTGGWKEADRAREMMMIRAMRYSFGRWTSAARETIDYIRPQLESLSDNALGIMLSDINAELVSYERNHKVMHEAELWIRLKQEIVEERARRREKRLKGAKEDRKWE